LACGFLLPEAVFTTFVARAAVGTIAWMAYWWITAPIDYAVTAFLPIVIATVLAFTRSLYQDLIPGLKPGIKEKN